MGSSSVMGGSSDWGFSRLIGKKQWNFDENGSGPFLAQRVDKKLF